MATRKQRAANRRNAQLSTGPVTPEGKAAVRLNALKHGFTSENATIFDEDEDAFDELRGTFLDHFQPAGRLAYVFRRDTDPLSTLGRYESRIERSFYRALHELQRLQAARQRPDPPPPAKTDSAKQTQIAPEPDPNPIAPNDLPPLVGQALPPATNSFGSLPKAAGQARPWEVPRRAAQALHYVSID
jgi:hypothetical protein